MELCMKCTYKGYTIRETISQGWQVGLNGKSLGWFTSLGMARDFIDNLTT